MSGLTGFAKLVNFYGRFLPTFSRTGFWLRGLAFQPVKADFSGQTWVVTGASGGIGRAATLGAAERGAHVIAVARSEEKLAALKAELPADAKGAIETVRCDLSVMAEVGPMADALARDGRKIDVLVNNVGILARQYAKTPEGFETSYATNVLGHFLLTEKLLAGRALTEKAAIINVTSGGLYNAPLNEAMLDRPEEKFSGVFAYATHKRAQLTLTDHWDDDPTEGGVSSYAMHPGWADTGGVKGSMPKFRKNLQLVLRNEAEGADTIIWLAANRPPTEPDTVWFDRKLRGAHVYDRTRTPAITPERLLERLDEDLAKAGASRAAAS
ncbi:MAG: SDR family NAD(P)-dependent oxidoreductase [Euryhalocaulis sp.]|uniref:SDR family NAD(P)-dependent oxidoreductase n=1 Tax=Euryhalocaulis sp. TaxID=2744307 RepID=UPI00181CF67B|nr:SDR family NAD(P)-dependent oxidoreductase [Euryhalocaulis sp.]MBA4800474.1 SDR family NAD(P)-dependent oxidoreductase [Euryhalocaulis sp.]